MELKKFILILDGFFSLSLRRLLRSSLLFIIAFEND